MPPLLAGHTPKASFGRFLSGSGFLPTEDDHHLLPTTTTSSSIDANNFRSTTAFNNRFLIFSIHRSASKPWVTPCYYTSRRSLLSSSSSLHKVSPPSELDSRQSTVRGESERYPENKWHITRRRRRRSIRPGSIFLDTAWKPNQCPRRRGFLYSMTMFITDMERSRMVTPIFPKKIMTVGRHTCRPYLVSLAISSSQDLDSYWKYLGNVLPQQWLMIQVHIYTLEGVAERPKVVYNSLSHWQGCFNVVAAHW